MREATAAELNAAAEELKAMESRLGGQRAIGEAELRSLRTLAAEQAAAIDELRAAQAAAAAEVAQVRALGACRRMQPLVTTDGANLV